MSSKAPNTPQKSFLIKVYPTLLQIKTIIKHIALKSDAVFQLSLLGKIKTDNLIIKEKLEKTVTETKHQLRNILGNPLQFGYFHSPENGVLFITGHLTETFLIKVDDRELASLPAGINGICRELGLNDDETKTYLSELKKNKYCLIIRGKNSELATIKPLLSIN